MSRAGEVPVADAVRVLASPLFVLALVVLAINDHVLKQVWPGPVTGKLSDLAGLVVAPLLLAVPLAAFGLRRPVPVAAVLTGVGFVLAKTSVTGAAATSAIWSLTGVPTLIRADVTDLVALPALGVAWWIDRSVRSSSPDTMATNAGGCVRDGRTSSRRLGDGCYELLRRNVAHRRFSRRGRLPRPAAWARTTIVD